jgi:2-polyprenyl-6-methoxyphenol hydroxylase-like FAD-dependent oxidoreductase
MSLYVGAGLAGCTAARLLALEGLRVALVESHRDIRTSKQLCTHFMQASAYPVLQRIELDQLIERVGGVRNGIDIWSRYGWTGDLSPLSSEGQPAFGYNIQRRTLDPILRQLAAETPGVNYLAGFIVRKVAQQDDSVQVQKMNDKARNAVTTLITRPSQEHRRTGAELCHAVGF